MRLRTAETPTTAMFRLKPSRTVAERVERYASAVGRENIIAGTDRGFAQTCNAVRTHPSVQWARIRAVAD
jgi:methionine synthase II (cobalamin-independent)